MRFSKTVSICITVFLMVSVSSVVSKTAVKHGADINKLKISEQIGAPIIAPEIYGHFSEHLGRCIYGGIWVGEDSDIPNVKGIRKDVLDALRNLNVPVLRWPGGCFADEYHWKDGIGPKDQRPEIVNTHWGMVTEDNSFGTHEFMRLCELLDCEAYIAGNVGSGTPEEMMDWVEYLTFAGKSEMANLRRKNGREEPWDVKYFGVGNENWGCGGNMTPEYYSDIYKRYQTYVKNYPGSRVKKIACGPNSWDTHWMEVLMRNCRGKMDAISLHYYIMTGGWGNKGSAVDFEEKDWFKLMDNALKVRDLLAAHIEIMDKYDPDKSIGLYVDEWGTWWNRQPGSKPGFLYQQNTIRDAVSAGIFLNEFNKHAKRVKMANIAQTVNVLQAMILTKQEKMILTPTYHVFEMYKHHQGAELVNSSLQARSYSLGGENLPALNVSASKTDNGIYVTICNINHQSGEKISIEVEGRDIADVSGRTLTANKINSHNTFSSPGNVQPTALNDVQIKGNTLSLELPAKSVSAFTVKQKN
ncbi:alpha-N-arabinofuranosidase [Sedimentisphaera salicampi]|uniref:alpha-N-arabinofuranosidase n=1 Tax=Sedimentisphaera salicampi TaxID=1941349 RepID=UPI000B9CA9E7|nr:alpha-L-arabinofuranosidase C-terminal domain-containing protein [Sedimentisphaera salicampi]OXU16014.1 Intracellular exo-alpha-L-arabinofuranosidase 2 [Sedimentisphaera salicampi]